MSGCASTEIRKLGSVRTFLQIPGTNCAKKTIFYGKNCQLMEMDALQQDYRAQGSPLRTWNRYSNTYCTVGQTSQPPDNQTFTVRFYETCEPGVPLPHTLRSGCRTRFINNHGLCRNIGDAANGYGSYQEIVDAVVLGENRGRRSSYDGADDALSNELTFELISIIDASAVFFSKIDLDGLCGVNSSLRANHVTFDCGVGCGQTTCGCKESCNDGTNTFYIPASCPGSDQNYLIYTRDGGVTKTTMLIPKPSNGTGVATTYPMSLQMNGRLYVVAYEEPATLYSIALDAHGVPTGGWTEHCDLGTTGKIIGFTGEEGVLHMLVGNTDLSASYYKKGDGYDPLTNGALKTFTVAQAVTSLASCNSDVIVGGAAGFLSWSADGGGFWNTVTVDAQMTLDIKDVQYVGSRMIVVGTKGEMWVSSDDGGSWSKLQIGSKTGTMTSVNFSGDTIGWTINSADDPYSTVLGGEEVSDWVNAAPRIGNWPSDITPLKAFVPKCADSFKMANTVIVMGLDANGDTSAYMGRARISGV